MTQLCVCVCVYVCACVCVCVFVCLSVCVCDVRYDSFMHGVRHLKVLGAGDEFSLSK